MSRWQQVTQVDEPTKSDGIDFIQTPQDRDVVQLARCEVIAMNFGQFTPGIVVTELQPSDLTNSERAAFGMGGV